MNDRFIYIVNKNTINIQKLICYQCRFSYIGK